MPLTPDEMERMAVNISAYFSGHIGSRVGRGGQLQISCQGRDLWLEPNGEIEGWGTVVTDENRHILGLDSPKGDDDE